MMGLLVLLGWAVGHAQQTLDSRVCRLSVVDGLKSNHVYCIRQDRQGYIWMGTENGLSRYDGYGFVNFTRFSPRRGQATDKRVGSLSFSPDGRLLYAVTSSRDTAVYDRVANRFEAYRTSTGRPSADKPAVTTLRGYRFVSAGGGDLIVVPPSGRSQRLHLIDRMSRNRTNNFFVASDSHGLFYIATYGAGLYTYRPDTHSLAHFTAADRQPLLPNDFLTCIMVDSQDNVWVGCEAVGVCCIRTQGHVTASYACPEPGVRDGLANNVRCIYPLSAGRYLVGTLSGRNYFYDVPTGRFSFAFDGGSGLYSYLKDRRGQTWAGTQGERVFDIVEDRRGRIWKACFDKGLLMTEAAAGRPSAPSVFLCGSQSQARVRDLELAPDGTLWIATNAGLYAVDTRLRKITPGDFRHYSPGGTLNGEEVDFVRCSPRGHLWIGVLGRGLVKARCQNGGKLRVLQTIDSRRGLPVNNVRSMVELPSGTLWVAMEEGVCQVSADGMAITPYGFSSDMEGNAFNENTAALAPDGTALFGSRYGLLAVKGETASPRGGAAAVQVTDVTVNGTSLLLNGKPLSGTLRLEHGQNSLIFHFSAFDYARPGSCLYQYCLEGADSTWSEPTSQNQAVYNNLPPGRYVFRVRAQGRGKMPATEFAVTILRPWYSTGWAWLAYVLAVSAMAAVLVKNGRERFRLRQQLKMDKQLADFRISFFTHIAHEFRTPIAIIQHAIDKMRREHRNGLPQRDMAAAWRGTVRLSRLVNQLMDFRRINTGHLRLQVAEDDVVAFARRVFHDFWDMGKQKGLNMVFTPFAKDCSAWFDPKALETILYNLLSNAVKYTPTGGTVQARLGRDADGQLFIEVANTGPALSPRQTEHLFEPFVHGYVSQGGMGIGLYVARSMARLHHGELGYERLDDKTVFRLTIPVQADCYSEEERQVAGGFAASGAAEAPAIPVQRMQPQPINNYRVAVVEDDPDMMEQIKGEVGLFFHIDAYTDGLSAMAGIKDRRPDGVICDVMLPGLDGYELVRRLRTDLPQYHVPVIMLTSLDDEAHQIKAYQAGADDYMVKPCSYQVLTVRMAQLIKWNARTEAGVKPAASETDSPAPASAAVESAVGPRILLSIEDKRFMEQVDTVIANHLSDAGFSISELAALLSVGRTTLFGRVKKLTGQSPNKYIQKARMEHARQLLADTGLSVMEVGCKVGVADAAYFYRLFKNYYGMSPSQYRKQV